MSNIQLETELSKQHKKNLYTVFWIHAFMFLVVLSAAIYADSSALLADSLDFIGDAGSYALSIYVMSRGVLIRAASAILKAIVMLLFGMPMMVYTIMRLNSEVIPDPIIMNISGILGILAHMVCIYFLISFRKGDSNMLSVWICTINDLISNVLIVIASIAIGISNSILPDIIAAAVIISMALYGACIILITALKEIKSIKDKQYVRANT